MKIVENHLTETNDGKRYHMCDEMVTDLSDTYMGEDATTGDIFRASQKEHGRCVSKVYVDIVGEAPRPIGWVFQKREQYEDSKETFIHETWVSLYDEHRLVLKAEPHYLK